MQSIDTPEEENEHEIDSEELGIAAERLMLAERVQTLEEELLRNQADMENQRKRAARDMEQARKFGSERILSELVQVADNLERGLEAAEQPGASIESIKEGKALTLSQLAKLLTSQGVEVVDPMGHPFDPELHQAMATEASEEYAPDTVVKVFQKGYRLHERLLRPAMVVVSKAVEG